MIPSEREVKAASETVARQIVEAALNKKDIEILTAGALMGAYYRGVSDTLTAQAVADMVSCFDQPVSGEMLRKWGELMGVSPQQTHEPEDKYRHRVIAAARNVGKPGRAEDSCPQMPGGE